MRTLAVTNQKGGSGKTTSAVNLAAALGERGKRVLVVDLDPQASASSWLGVRDGGRGLLEVFTEGGKLAPLVQESTAPGVDVVPASTWLVGVEALEAGQAQAGPTFRRALAALPDRWDFVLVDCPPSLGSLSLAALTACREVLVTVEATSLALAGLAALLQTVERVRDHLNPELAVSAILVCRYSTRRNLSRDVVDRLRESFGPLVLESVVRDSARLAEAWSFSKPVTLYAPTSPGAEDYRAAAAEMLKKARRSA